MLLPAQAEESVTILPHDQLRVRAAWLYYVEGLTQAEVAKRLGVNRIMITRLLADARSRGEVVIRIKSDIAPIVEMQRRLEERFGLGQAIVAPFSEASGDPTQAIAAAAGAYVSRLMTHRLTVGVGWGRTLQAMLAHVEGRALEDVRVVSLLGGIALARRFNPAEFAWQFAELFGAEGYLIPAPALVDSRQTRHALLEHCGLQQVLQMAESCDIALISCGGIESITTSYRVGHVTEADRRSLIEAGAIGDVLYNFIDRDGKLVNHPVNERSIALSLEGLARIGNRALIAGGVEKRAIILATLKLVRPRILVTDEVTARHLLDQPVEPADR
jgi:DNA-binding transcriptional regulator LsrR (DeoR family)